MLVIFYTLTFLASFISGKEVDRIWPVLPERIVGGELATKGEFPFIVSLRIRGSHSCGGSIINANTILTAAHCSGSSASKYSVAAGVYKLNVTDSDVQIRTVSKITKHARYNSRTFENDIALMKVSPPFTFGTFVQPATLPPSSFTPSGDLVTAGWGTTSEGGRISNVLLKVTVPFVSTEVCIQNYGADEIKPGMICAGTGGKDSCQGDSGGPLLSGPTKILTGVVSWGTGCARPNYPGVYTSVPFYANWISQNIFI